MASQAEKSGTYTNTVCSSGLVNMKRCQSGKNWWTLNPHQGIDYHIQPQAD